MLVTADAGPATSVGHLWLADFRCLGEIDVELASGLTVVQGANGQGKTSFLEAIGWVARARSFRGVTDAMLVRSGATEAIVRAEVTTSGRQQLFEAEIRATGRNRVMCNRQAVTRARDLHGLLRVTVFAPDDLTLVKGGPAERRDFLDELLAMLAARYDAARSDFERVLKQRNALLRSGVREDQLREALARRRRAEIDRGLTLVGPHRDELHLKIDGLDARYQASQGEQRTLALALRLAGHVVVRELTGAAPVLLLDDVFSELDAQRAAALVRNLPPGQTLLTTAGALPPDVVAQQNLVVRAGRIETRSP